VLISHDNGWAVIQNENGTIDFELFGDKEEKPYATIFNVLIPKLKEAGFDQEEIDLLLIKNPAEAYKIEVCTL
jgi:phosphotriesterase-related protein